VTLDAYYTSIRTHIDNMRTLTHSFAAITLDSMAKSKAVHLQISKRALIVRINRRLASRDMVLKVARGARMHLDVGHYYVLNVRRNAIVRSRVSLEQLAQELDALQPWEDIAAAG
jgi:hypothetical protein